MPFDVGSLVATNVAESLDIKAGDCICVITSKQCIALGNYRVPPTLSSTMQGVEDMPETWLAIAISKELNAMGNVLLAIRTGFATAQPHLVKQLQLCCEGVFKIGACPKLALNNAPQENDLTATQLWRLVEHAVMCSRALVNYMRGKAPKSGTTAAITVPSVETTTAATGEAVTKEAISKLVKSSVDSALAPFQTLLNARRNNGGQNNSGIGGGRRNPSAGGGGKRRRW